MAIVTRVRPLKSFRVIRPHGNYVKGAIIQPTGIYRDVLLKKGVIVEIKDEDYDVPIELDNREILPRAELMKRGPGRPRKIAP